MDSKKVGSSLPERNASESRSAPESHYDYEATLQRLVSDLKSEVVAPLKEELEAARGPKSLWSIKDVARRLGISLRTAENLVRAGDISPISIRGGKIRRFDPEAVEAYIRSCARRNRGGRVGR